MRMFMKLLAACLLTTPIMAASTSSYTYTYDWSDGNADFLGTFDTDITATTSLEANQPESAGYGLVLTKNTSLNLSMSSLGFLATIWNLQAGDEVTAGFWRWDDSTSYPNLQVWAHYNNDLYVVDDDYRSQQLQLNHGFLSHRTEYGDYSGWEEISHTWVIAPGNTGVVITARLWGNLGDSILLDDLTITVPEHAIVRMPNAVYIQGEGVRVTEATTLTDIKALFK